MICPKCKSARLGVMDSVDDNDANETYRKRKCLECGNIFFTVEFEAEVMSFIDNWNKYHRSTNKT